MCEWKSESLCDLLHMVKLENWSNYFEVYASVSTYFETDQNKKNIMNLDTFSDD